ATEPIGAGRLGLYLLRRRPAVPVDGNFFLTQHNSQKEFSPCTSLQAQLDKWDEWQLKSYWIMSRHQRSFFRLDPPKTFLIWRSGVRQYVLPIFPTPRHFLEPLLEHNACYCSQRLPSVLAFFTTVMLCKRLRTRGSRMSRIPRLWALEIPRTPPWCHGSTDLPRRHSVNPGWLGTRCEILNMPKRWPTTSLPEPL